MTAALLASLAGLVLSQIGAAGTTTAAAATAHAATAGAATSHAKQPLHWSALEEVMGVPAWKSLPTR